MASADDTLSDRIEHYSRSASRTVCGHAWAEDVLVLVPPRAVNEVIKSGTATLAQGFVRARELLGQGQRVRLISHGATVRGTWPEWVASCEGLTLTELGAYRVGNPSDQTRELSSNVRMWLEDLFEGTIEGVPNASVFYASAAARLLQPLFEAVTYVHGLAQAHPHTSVDCIDPDWIGLRLLNQALGLLGGPTAETRLTSWRWRGQIAAHFAYRFLRAAAGQIRNFIRSAPSRRRVGELRARRFERPAIWIGMVPDWRRINRHLIDGVAIPALERGDKLGVLLCTTLLPGERFDDTLGERRGSTLWPALEMLETLDDMPVEQIVGPEGWRGMIGLLARGAHRSAVVALRLARLPPVISSGSLQIDLSRHMPVIAALATTDVLQALAAAQGVAELMRRHDFNGASIAFASLGLVETATADLLFQTAGATTVDFVHGSGGDNWFGMTETTAVYRAVWSKTDAETCRKIGATPLLVRPPGQRRLLLKHPRAIQRVLLMTNYVHVDTGAAHFPLQPFQTELLHGMALLNGAFAELSEFRWRPHPCDDREIIERDIHRVPGLDLSVKRRIEDDISWSDIIITSPSSTMIDALLAGRPLFLHVPPAMRSLVELEAVDADRKFFYAAESVAQIGQFLRTKADDPERALAPEQSTQRALFGDALDELTDVPAALASAKAAETRPWRS